MEWILDLIMKYAIGGGPIGWAGAAIYIAAVAYGSRGKWEPLFLELKKLVVADLVILVPGWAFVKAVARSTADGKYAASEMATDRAPFVSWFDSLISVFQQLYAIMIPAQLMVIASRWVLSKAGIVKS